MHRDIGLCSGFIRIENTNLWLSISLNSSVMKINSILYHVNDVLVVRIVVRVCLEMSVTDNFFTLFLISSRWGSTAPFSSESLLRAIWHFNWLYLLWTYSSFIYSLMQQLPYLVQPQNMTLIYRNRKYLTVNPNETNICWADYSLVICKIHAQLCLII